MELILGATSICLSVLLFCIVLIGARDPRNPKWASDTWVAYCHSIVILGLGVAGIMALGSAVFAPAAGTGKLHVLISAAIIALTAMGVKAMNVRGKLSQFEQQAAIGAQAGRNAAGPDGGDNAHFPEGPRMAA